MKYIIEPFKQILNTTGKANKKEFFIFFFFTILVAVVLGFFKKPLGIPESVSLLVRLIFLVPLITLGFRRLNEAGILKWLFLIPIINVFIALSPAKKT